jgi:hypothetical protein
MLPSVRAFFSGIIDYAGLFPPAKLSLERAVANYAKYRAGGDAWMLGRFVIPAARLSELEPLASLFPGGAPMAFSVLGRGGETHSAFLEGLDADLHAVWAFRSRHGERVSVEAFEVKLPYAFLQDPRAVEWRTATARLGEAQLGAWYEWNYNPLNRATTGEALDSLAGGGAGIKLRCGGVEASDFPTPEDLAFSMALCRDRGLRLKFTAGLHHPIRRHDRGLQTKMHGFVNVFGAGILARARQLTELNIRAVLEEEQASHFGFNEIGFGWKEYHVLIDEIIAARRDFVVSFGSCSFDEPRDDLRAMGLLT